MSSDLLELIKSEYIGTKASLRELAERYDVSFTALRSQAYKGGWKDKRKQMSLLQGVSRAEEAKAAGTAETVTDVARVILHNVAAVASDETNPMMLRQLALTLKDVAELIGYLNPVAKREANARIKKLETEAKRLESGAEPIEIVIKDDELKEWAK